MSTSEKEINQDVDQSDEEIQQSLDYLALLIQTHLDLRASVVMQQRQKRKATLDKPDTSAAVNPAKHRLYELIDWLFIAFIQVENVQK